MQHLQEILPTNISLTYDNYTDILPVENNNTKYVTYSQIGNN